MRTLGQFTVSCYLTLGVAVSAQAQTATGLQETLPESSSPIKQSADGDAKATPQPDAKPEVVWEQQRDYSQHRYNSLLGGTGLLHTVAADSGAPGTFRISFLSSYFTGSGFLCPTATACGPQPIGNGNEDSASRTAADLSISATLAPFLEASVGTHSHALSDNFGKPSVIQVLGDSFLGLKGFTPRKADRILSAGGFGQLRFLNSAGNIGIHTADVTLAALGTIDLSNRTDPKRRVPVRFHLNFGYLFDNSSKIAENIEKTRNHSITRIERNGFGINKVDSLFMGVGTEYVGKILQPFAEWTVDVASNRQGYQCVTRNLSASDVCLVRTSGMSGTPSRLTLGTRLTPQFHGLSGTVAFDIGTSGSAFTDERTTELPWNLYLGLAYAIDTVSAPIPVQKAPEARVVKVPPPPEYHIQGTVTDEESSQPIARAQIQFDGQDYTGLVSRANGSFESGNVKPGEYKLLLTAEGYKDGNCAVTVEAGKENAYAPTTESEIRNSEVKCSLKAAPALGTLYGTLVDADTGTPVPQAALKIRDERDRSLELQSNETGGFRVENVPAGQVHILITATGYLPMTIDMEIKKKVEQHAALVMHKLPKKPNVTVTTKELKVSTQVRFDNTSAEISHESQGIVQEIAATLLQHSEITSVEIQVYTDEDGSATYNKRLSEQRAGSVRAALVALGVDSSRLTATGFGSEKPLVTNATTEAGHAKNRRVQFVIPKHD